MVLKELQETISRLDTNTINCERIKKLELLIQYIQNQVDSKKEAQLNFICTHNSRRSQLAQVWAQAISVYYAIPTQSYSGGTEITACHENTVKTLVKSGFIIKKMTVGNNPKYDCKYGNKQQSLHLYSKLFDSDKNPIIHFAAIMTCDQAEKNCPLVSGCDVRITLPFDDPKKYDDTEYQDEKYLERSIQIATELKYVYAQIKKL